MAPECEINLSQGLLDFKAPALLHVDMFAERALRSVSAPFICYLQAFDFFFHSSLGFFFFTAVTHHTFQLPGS